MMENQKNKDWRGILDDLGDRLFPVRQFYYRSQGNVRFISLNKSAQGILTTFLVAAFGWVVFASVYLLFKDHIIEAKTRQISNMELAYEHFTQELSDTQDHFDALTSDLEARHKQLLDFVYYKGSLEHKLSALTDELDAVISERDKALPFKPQLKTQVEHLKNDLSDKSNRNSTLSDLLEETGFSLSQIAQDREGASKFHHSAAKRVVALERRLTELQYLQQNLINRIQDRAHISVNEMESMVKLTGLDLGALLHLTDSYQTAQGGPLVSLDPTKSANEISSMGNKFQNSVLELEMRLGRWEGLQQVLQTLPLTPPADHYYLSSGFGKRKDPFTKRWAMHYGLDFAGPFKTIVHATAAGVVTFAGRKGPYGRLVEIDHGLDIKTRYAHLHKILVKKGSKVKFRQKIGMMGSTGRSTGSHVHYEVLFKGRSQNPEKFLKAGKYVFKD
jgi:murein DD-endopeptidase MepM/ murein hydrolase activator NlpD